MKELLTEDLLNSLRLMKYDRSRTLMENNSIVEQTKPSKKEDLKKYAAQIERPGIGMLEKGRWDRLTKGDDLLWMTLKSEIEKLGISVKYGADGKQVTDPHLAKFMYWGQWLIWKDYSKNGYYPIQLYKSSGSALLKWRDINYKGETLNKSIVEYKKKEGVVLVLSDVLKINSVEEINKLVQKIEVPKNLKTTEEKIKVKYGNNAEYFVGNKQNDISLDAITARYKSGNFNDIYDLIILPDYDGNKGDLEDLKYHKETVKIGNYESIISEKDKKVKYGLNIYKKALQVRKSLANTAGWSGPESVLFNYSYALSDFGQQDKMYEILQSPNSIAIDPTDLEVTWVQTKIKYLNTSSNEKSDNRFLIGTFENIERLKIANYGIPSFPKQTFNIPQNISLDKWFEQKAKEWDNYSGVSMKSNNSLTGVETNPWKNVLKGYQKSLNDYIKSQTKDTKTTKEKSSLQRQIEELKTAIDMVYERNLNLSKQTANYINLSCKKIMRTQVGSVNKDFQSDKATLEKLLPAPDDQYTYSYDNKWFVEFNLKDLCTKGKLGGVFTMTSDEKNRTYLKGFDWKKLNFIYVDEKRPDNVSCFCSNMKILEYDKIRIKGDLSVDIYKTPKNPRVQNLVGSTLYQTLSVRKNFEASLNPYQSLYNTADNRTFTQKALDWTKKCFTASNDEGEMGKDFHCLLDVASIAATFIPVVGPVISLVLDTLNALYFVSDAIKADNNLDKNSAYFSAALTFIGGLATGFGDARALIKKSPSGIKILGYAENYWVKSSKIYSKGLGKDALEKELKELMLEMNRTYKLTSAEMTLAQKYMNSIELLGKDQAAKILSNYKKSLDNLQSKIGFRRWGELMQNDMFIEFMKKSNGNIFEALKLMNKKIVKKEFWQQFGFFVGGESILPELISPPIMEKIKKGEWGTFEQQLSLNRYDLASVIQEFMIDTEFDIEEKLIPSWNEKCKQIPIERYCVKVDGKFKPWRPGYVVPLNYRTNNYKNYLKDKEKQEELFKEFEKFQKETQESLDKFYDVKVMKDGKLIGLFDELESYSVVVPSIEKNKSKISQMCDNTDYETHEKLTKLNTVFTNLKTCKKENIVNKENDEEEKMSERSIQGLNKAKKIKW